MTATEIGARLGEQIHHLNWQDRRNEVQREVVVNGTAWAFSSEHGWYGPEDSDER